jgi:hypothetical protein
MLEPWCWKTRKGALDAGCGTERTMRSGLWRSGAIGNPNTPNTMATNDNKNKGQGTDKDTNASKPSTHTGATKAADTTTPATAKAKNEEGNEKKDKSSNR